MTELLPGLYSVSVPEESSNFDLGKHYGSIAYDMKGYTKYYPLPDLSNYEIVGTVTADTIDFDCEPFLVKTGEHYDGDLFWCFGDEKDKWAWEDDAFRSLLTSKGQHFVNPMGDEMPILEPECCGFIETDEMGFPQCCCQPVPTAESRKRYDDWHEAEQNLVKKLVLIKSKVMGNTTEKTSTEVMTNALSTYDKCKILPSELLQQRDELLAAAKKAREIFFELFEENLYPKSLLQENGGEGVTFLTNIIQKIENHV